MQNTKGKEMTATTTMTGVDDSYSFLPSDDETDPQEALDRAVAVALHENLNRTHETLKREQQDKPDMYSSNTGKALDFTQKILANHVKMMEMFHILGHSADLSNKFALIKADDIVCLAERLLHRQESFGRDAKDIRVDIGYRYIHREGMSRIRTNGLQSDSTSDYGAGVYTANNPFAAVGTCDGGDKLLLVARLKGLVDSSGGAEETSNGRVFDTVIARSGATDGVCVLSRSSQVIPILKIDSTLVDAESDLGEGNSMIHIYHCHLQNVVDSCFNAEIKKTAVPKVLPSQVTVRKLRASVSIPIPSHISLKPSTKPVPNLNSVLYYSAPEMNNFPTNTDLAVEQAPTNTGQACGKPSVGNLPKRLQIFRKRMRNLMSTNSPRRSWQSSIRELPKGMMLIDADSKPATLVVDSVLYEQNTATPSKHEMQRRHCSHTDNYVAIVPLRSENAAALDSYQRFSFAYACGSTFDVSLTLRQDEQSVSELWSDMFASATFLQRIQMRVKEHSKKCSSCCKTKSAPREKIAIGMMPTGIMRVDELPELVCSGHDAGTISISYRFQNTLIGENSLVTFLPNNEEGRDLLKRLKFAFSRGLTFAFTAPLSNETASSTTWWTIPHKTSLGTGACFGFPDPEYFAVANKELDSLKVPSADKL